MNPCGKSYGINGNLAISSFPLSLRIHKSKEKQTSLKMQNYKNTKLQNYKTAKLQKYKVRMNGSLALHLPLVT